MNKPTHRKTLDEEGLVDDIHYPIFPINVRKGEGVVAFLRFSYLGRKIEKEMQVWRMSPLGIELLVNKGDEILPKGSAVDLEIQIGHLSTVHNGLVVDIVAHKRNITVIGIRLVKPSEHKSVVEERRQNRRWFCNEEFYPTALSPNPIKFNDYMYFKVRDISASGMRLLTSFRNKFIVSGARFEAMVSFPMTTSVQIQFVVRSVRVEMLNGKEYLSVGVEYENIDQSSLDVISQYLLQFGDVESLKDLRIEGFSTSSLAEAVEYGFVQTDSEYKEVLKLRHLAYSKNGKISPDELVENMGDSYDSHSRILIGKYKGRIVSSARLTFIDEGTAMEQESYVEWPAHLPRREDVVEVTRLCTDPEFRGSDLLTSALQFLAITAIQARKRWITVAATEKYFNLYNKIGFKSINLKYNHPIFNNMEHEILLADVPSAMTGGGVGPIYWNVLWEPVSKYLINYKSIKLTPFAYFRMNLYRWYAPLSLLLKRNVLKPRRK